jgi:hypothetical protein
MLQFSARGFYLTGKHLEFIKFGCQLDSINLPGETPLFNYARLVSGEVISETIDTLHNVESQCRAIGLDISADTVVDIREGLNNTRNCQWLLDQVNALHRLLEKETKGKFFFYSPPERAKFFPRSNSPHPFGDEVGTAFPSAIFDIYESALCLGLARSTAAVFHLMRTLEIGLACLGSVFGVSLAHTNWEPAIRDIESKIREMHKDPKWKAESDCKEKQESYAQAASHFGILKDAWRNYTMHIRGKYTEEEAEQIFMSTKAFIQKLASLGLKEIV